MKRSEVGRGNQNSHAVPGSAAGFAYQFGRALYWLATEKGNFEVGIETLDDVSLERQTGPTLLEQDKYSIQNTGQPVSNRSVALWKTLSHWSDLLRQSSKQYHFLLVTNRPVPADTLVRKLSDAITDGQAMAVMQEIAKIAKKPSEVIESFCRNISKCEPNILQRLICSITLASSDSAQTEWEALQKETIDGLRLPSALLSQETDILNELIGWLVNTCMNAWNSGKTSTITSQSFINVLDRVKERRRRQYTRERPPSQVPITPDDLAGIVKDLFVEQLKLLDAKDSEIVDAVNDFIRYGKEIIRLTETGEYTPKDWEELEEELQTRWKRIFDRVQRLHNDEEEKLRGVRTYYETTTNFLARLMGEPTDHAYFTTGAYHRLADELDVGWHPRFLELLTGKRTQ